MKLLQYDKLIAVIHDDERRLGNGLLGNPPELFVSVYNEEQDRYEVCPITWAAAETLAPRQVKCLAEELNLVRRARDLKREQKAKEIVVEEKIRAALVELPPGPVVQDAHMAAPGKRVQARQ